MGRVQWKVVRIVRRRFGVVTRWLECNYYNREEDGGVEGAGLRLYAKRSKQSLRGREDRTGSKGRREEETGEVTGDAAYIHAKRPA